jgi:hypothetical protein
MYLNKIQISLSGVNSDVSLTCVLYNMMAPHSVFTQSHFYLRDFNQLVIHIKPYTILMMVRHIWYYSPHGLHHRVFKIKIKTCFRAGSVPICRQKSMGNVYTAGEGRNSYLKFMDCVRIFLSTWHDRCSPNGERLFQIVIQIYYISS